MSSTQELVPNSTMFTALEERPIRGRAQVPLHDAMPPCHGFGNMIRHSGMTATGAVLLPQGNLAVPQIGDIVLDRAV